jgi:hypothetical protein
MLRAAAWHGHTSDKPNNLRPLADDGFGGCAFCIYSSFLLVAFSIAPKPLNNTKNFSNNLPLPFCQAKFP